MIKEINYQNINTEYENLQNLSILIPTRDRNYYLSRWLWYTTQFPFGKIIIEDSSSDEKKRINQETIQKVIKETGANILYLDCASETDPLGGDVFRKWGVGLKFVETEYCKMCTDKEYVLPQTLSECVVFLSKHPDYVAAEGDVYRAFNENSTINSENYYLKWGFPDRKSEISDVPIERFEHAFVVQKSWNYNMLVAVIRTDVNKYLYQLLDDYQISGIRYAEIILGYFGYLIGKFYYNPNWEFSVIDFVLRNNAQFKITDGQGTTQSCASRYPYFDDYISMGVSDEFYSAYKHCLKDQLIKFTTLNSKMIENYVEHKITLELLYYYGRRENTKNSKMKKILFHLYSKNTIYNSWYKLPIEIRKFVQGILLNWFHMNVPIDKNIVNPPYSPELEAVISSIKRTLYLHNTDTPISSWEMLNKN